MTDREKVITHFNDAIEASGNGNTWRFVRVDVLEDAIKLLKEREPVKPKQMGTVTHWYACGACQMPVDYEDAYCRGCGRGLKWYG